MTIRGFWRDVRDRLRHDRPHPDDRWTEVANEAVFGRRDADDWRRDRDYYGRDDDSMRRWPRDQGYDEYRDRGFGAGTELGAAEITSGFFELTQRDSGAFADDEQTDFRGVGPLGFRRSDQRIREDVCECLTQDEDLDASEIEVGVTDGEVTLTGKVTSRLDKRYAEDLSARVSGVRDVHNLLRTELQ